MAGDPVLRIEGIVGANERWTAEPDQASRLQDVEWDERGGWERCGGNERMLRDTQPGTNPFDGQGKVNSLYWWSRHGGAQQFLMFELGTNLCYFNGSTNGWEVLKTNRFTTDAPWQGTQYAAIGNNCWILNGVNAPLRFDGRTAHKAGFDGPAPPVIAEGFGDGFVWGTSYKALGLGTTGMADRERTVGVTTDLQLGNNGYGEYAYVITEINEFGTESPPSPVYAQVKWEIDAESLTARTAHPKYFVRVRIPPPSHAGVKYRRLWRTVNTYGVSVPERVFYLCADDIGGVGEVVHIDALPDALLGLQLQPEKMGPFPTTAKYMSFFKGHAFYAGMSSDPGRLVYSAPANPESVPLASYFLLGDSDAGEITGMREYRNTLVVFKRRGIFMIMSDGQGGFQQKTISRQFGCSAPNTIKEIPGIGLSFVSDNGVRVIRGTLQEADDPAAIPRLDESLGDTWLWKINRAALLNACAEVYHRKRELWLSVPYGGVPDNKMVLVYHYDVGVWSFRPNLNAGCLAESHDHRGYLFIGSNDAADHAGVHIYSSGFTTRDGAALSPSYESAWLDLGGVYQHFTPRKLMVRILDYGTSSMTATTYKDRRTAAVNTGGQSRAMRNAEYNQDPRPVWNTAQWSTTLRWTRAAPTVIVYDPGSGVAGATSQEFKVVLSSSSRCQIIGMRLSIDPGPRIDALNAVTATGTEV